MKTITRSPLASILALAAACGSASLPDPKILSVTPANMVACKGAAVTVAVEAVLPTHLDYNKSEATVVPDFDLRIGPISIGSQYLRDGILMATVPPLLAPGVYDVGLRFWDGRPEAVLARAFTVTPNPSLAGFSIDSVPVQTRNVPFLITIRALGPNAPVFECSAGLSTNRGTITPVATGRFQQGLRTELVTLGTAYPSMVITVMDAETPSRSVSSNPFQVNP